jgi:hypothetical protein
MNVRIRNLLPLRHKLSDQVLLDYLTFVHMAPEPGTLSTSDLRQQWCCSQPHVSRRINAVAAAGLIDVTAGYGEYFIHHVNSLNDNPQP